MAVHPACSTKPRALWAVTGLCAFVAILSTTLPAADRPRTDAVVFYAGFEEGEGYSEGELAGQKGWSGSEGGGALVETGGHTQWAGHSGKGWLVVKSYQGQATTPVFDTSKHEAVDVRFAMRPAGLGKNAHWGGVVYFTDEHGTPMTRLFLPRTAVNVGDVFMYNGSRDTDTGLDWRYEGAGTVLRLRLVLIQSSDARRWELTVNGRTAQGTLMRDAKGSLSRLIFQGGLGNSWDDLTCYDEVVVKGVPRTFSLTERHVRVGKRLDSLYSQEGHRVDIAGFDLRELLRQGRPVGAALLRQVEDADDTLRRHWIQLDERRSAIAADARTLPPTGRFLLRIEDLEESGPGESGWFGWRQARLTWTDGTVVDIPLSAFHNAVYRASYAYQCEPSAAAFVYGRKASQCVAQAGFDLSPIPPGDAELELSGLDHDKPGTTRIRLALNGHEIFSGPNPFGKKGWSTHRFAVPRAAFSDTATTDGAASVRRRLHRRFDALDQQVEAFGNWAAAKAAALDTATSVLRRGLVYRQRKTTPDWWRRGFLRGMCFETSSPPGGAHAVYRHDPEHVAKSFRDAEVDFVYGYIGASPTLATYLAAFEAVGLPYVQAASWHVGRAWQPKHPRYLTDRRAMAEDAATQLDPWRRGHPNFAGLAIDEPTVQDTVAGEAGVAGDPAIRALFDQYLSREAAEIGSRGAGQVPDRDDMPHWLSWQLFKEQLMADHWSWFWHHMAAKDLLVFPIIMNWNHHQPQGCSYVAMGAKLPLIATDLYNNGSAWEGLGMRLLRSAAAGRAIMVPGSGYSSKDPDRFRRSLAVGLAHADGLLQWIEVYASKYRNPEYFWRLHNGELARDDRGREMLGNWHHAYWGVQTDMYRRAAAAEDCLVGTESGAKALLLHSERTAILDPGPTFRNTLGVYSNLIRTYGRAFDVGFVESTSAEQLARYQAAVLPDTRCLTEDETDRIEHWVRSGGTLLATGDTTSCDQWGRPQEDFALAELFGVRRTGTTTGADSFEHEGVRCRWSRDKRIATIAPLSGTQVVAAWDTGEPALVRHTVGEGAAWLVTVKGLGAQLPGVAGTGGLPGQGMPGLDSLPSRLLASATDADPVSLGGLPEGVEVVLRRKGTAVIVHLIDWVGGREIAGAELVVNAPGQWEVLHPDTDTSARGGDQLRRFRLRPFRIYDLAVARPAGG